MGIKRSKISNVDEHCYSSVDDDDFANIIYNAVVEYALDEYEIEEMDFQRLHRLALISKLKFETTASEEQKLKYGFYGEVILYCMLHIFFQAPPLISRGHFYNPLENSETKGYDAFHIVNNDGAAELWFGEVKFYKDFPDATTGKNGAITNLSKAISDGYLNKNLLAISNNSDRLKSAGSILEPILKDIRQNPEIKILDLVKFHNMKLVYPILILFDEHSSGYDETIKSAIKHIEDKVPTNILEISVDVSLFFILVPLGNSKNIKSKVLEWIRDSKQLMS